AILGIQIMVLEPGKHRCTIRVGANGFDLWILLFEKQRCPRQRATSADRGDETSYLARSLFPDLRSSCLEMHTAIGDIVELTGPEPAFFFSKPLRVPVIVSRVTVGLFRHCNYFGAQGAQQVNFFDRLSFGDNNNGAVSLGLTHNRQADAGVSGGALD